MELRQLSYVEAVARYGGFTRAAERLHVAQSAVSAQIRSLEAELGVALFARTTRRVALTPAGELFVNRARRVLAELDGARTEVSDLTTVVTGRVSLGATAGVGPYDLPGALARFHQRFPQIALRLRAGRVAGLLGALDAGELDLVIGPAHPDLPARFGVLPLADEQLVLALPPAHPLAGPADQPMGRDARLALVELRDEPFACLPPGSGLRRILDDAARTAGFTPRVPYEAHSVAEVRELVAAGLGVALLPRSAAERVAGPAVAVRYLHPPPTHPPIAVMHHRDRPLEAAAQACRHHLAEISGRQPGPGRQPETAPEEADGAEPSQPARTVASDASTRR